MTEKEMLKVSVEEFVQLQSYMLLVEQAPAGMDHGGENDAERKAEGVRQQLTLPDVRYCLFTEFSSSPPS